MPTAPSRQLYDGDRLKLHYGKSFLFECCGCGLTHRFTLGKGNVLLIESCVSRLTKFSLRLQNNHLRSKDST
jgi:hypothetical protein